MPKRKSTVFVGSSSEAQEIADQFCNKLRDAATVVHWKDAPEFRSTYSTMENLFDATKKYDYAVFIFTPDDRYLSRGKEGAMGRDNVLFEFGLFLGALGADRVAAFVQKGDTEEEEVKTPSDLWGINMPRFRADKKAHDKTALISEVDSATLQFRQRINRLGPRPLGLHPAVEWGFDPNTQQFSILLGREQLANFSDKIAGMKLCIVVRKRDDYINNNEDKQIAKSPLRSLPRPLNSDMAFKIETADKIQSVETGDIVDAYLWLVPPGCDVDSAATMEEMFEIGCELLEDMGCTVKPKGESHD